MFVLQELEIDKIRARFPKINELRTFTKERLRLLAELVSTAGFTANTFVVANGSYARHEASQESDLDFYLLCKCPSDVDETRSLLRKLQPKLREIAGKSPSTGGAFGDVHIADSLLKNIGGNDDSNQAITRRILFLLEGFGIVEQREVERLRNDLICTYVKPEITSHQIALFLLNDIIRYYRTICVDFEFKTVGGQKLKPWGTRNIKLTFSRKFLYFSGILAVAETAQCSSDKKAAMLNRLLGLPVVDRVIACCGEKAVPALKHYEYFLEEMSKTEVRDELNSVEPHNPKQNAVFRGLKDCGHHFSWELLLLLKNTYEQSHPIHRSIVL